MEEAIKLIDLCTKHNVEIAADWGNKAPWDHGQQHWHCTLKMGRKRIIVDFWSNREPSAADVLYCLCSDAWFGEMSFSEFCRELGENEDSRKAEKTWRSCKKLAPRVRRFLGDLFEDFATAEH